MKKAVPVLIGVALGVMFAGKIRSLPLVSKLPSF